MWGDGGMAVCGGGGGGWRGVCWSGCGVGGSSGGIIVSSALSVFGGSLGCWVVVGGNGGVGWWACFAVGEVRPWEWMLVFLLGGVGAAAVDEWWGLATVLRGLVGSGVWAGVLVGLGGGVVSSGGGRYVGGCTAVWVL